MKALFIGRFQPFHNGHLRLLQHICKLYDEIIIGIGSSQYRNTIDNPFSEDERKRMIEKSLYGVDINNFRIVSIPDIHNPPKWVSHVLSIVQDFDVVISNDAFTKKLFSEKGYLVKGTPFFEREKYSGVEIRRRMINGEQWKNFVPEAVKSIIEDIKGAERLKELSH